MEGVIRRQYLGGAAAAVGGLLAVACGEPEVRYVEKQVEKIVEQRGRGTQHPWRARRVFGPQ